MFDTPKMQVIKEFPVNRWCGYCWQYVCKTDKEFSYHLHQCEVQCCDRYYGKNNDKRRYDCGGEMI